MKAKHSMRRDFGDKIAHDVGRQEKNAPTIPGEPEISSLAYQFWLERGCPEGCPEEDWFRAERELAQAVERSR